MGQAASKMPTSDPHLLVFISLCNSLPLSIGWTYWFTSTKQNMTEVMGMSLLILSYKKTVAFILSTLPYVFLCTCTKGSQLLCYEIPWGVAHMATNEGRPQSNILGGKESCQKPSKSAWKWILSHSSLQMRTQPWITTWWQLHERSWSRGT